ncbi:hypothetical protein SAMN02910298_01421 [Pseudobutyrivibrio sp. YE44]|uniref:AAA family ATPase n=1 Tax=Pseudobutyrivibrio sp. YE44 TaxID=1520802 RepID=UPI00087E76EE|nr:ATP-binding protein [Pseudobutyrivibrio sp. YE44]SDB29159.1 hypothetical protein SAMN02910298_01421 [Pseudobutyrivibrio sp. YE44]
MIGRYDEIKELNRLYDSGEAEFVVVYGRRRVGKTYLINEVFEDRFAFRHTGLSPVEKKPNGLLKAQLEHFYLSLQMHGMKKSHRPKSWLEAFFMLEQLLMDKDDGKRQVIFFDELPWMDTPRSGFVTALEAFWNSWACARKNIMLVVCGSASSWILDNLINNYGGLYNRTTYQMKLSQFNLSETKMFLERKNVSYSKYDIVQSYMIFGGIPYYLGYMRPELSLSQNIDKLFFDSNAILSDEYNRLFESIFSKPDQMKAIVELLNKRGDGYTRNEIIESLSLSDGGNLSDDLNALVASDFVMRYTPFAEKGKVEYYKLIDPFCKFFLYFVQGRKEITNEFWASANNSSQIVSWRGFSFENVCINHINEIQTALGIPGVKTSISSWRKKASATEKGYQIDLIIDRADNVVNMCEMKYYGNNFKVTKDYYMQLRERQSLLENEIDRKKVVRNTLVTTFGLDKNEYSGIFTNIITMDDLIK